MSNVSQHEHNTDCGHPAIRHEGHVDYLNAGHLEHFEGGVVSHHVLSISEANPSSCTGGHLCAAHGDDHKHGEGCGHAAVPHGDHIDYLVNGHLHHPHDGHCDHHGEIHLA